MQVIVTFLCNQQQMDRLRQTVEKYDNTIIFLCECKTEEQKKYYLLNADIIIGEPDIELIQQNPKLRWVQMTWAGTDKYTGMSALEKDCQKKGFPKEVLLTNMSGAFGMIMSEYAIGAILQIYRRFYNYREQQKLQLWADAGSEECLYGKRVLLLGTGDIGTSVARKCKAFDMYTVGLRRNSHKTNEYFDEMHSLNNIDEEIKKADIVICSLPDKPNTRNLLTKERILSMKADAILLNMGRGSLLDTYELAEILQSGHLKAAILDVTNPEPLPKDHPLWQCENAMITPHIAGPSIGHCKKTQDFIVQACCENLHRYFTGEKLLHTIEEEDFEYQRK